MVSNASSFIQLSDSQYPIFSRFMNANISPSRTLCPVQSGKHRLDGESNVRNIRNNGGLSWYTTTRRPGFYVHARGNCVSLRMLLNGWKTEQERERDRRSYKSLVAHRAYRRAYMVAINIPRRHLPDRSRVCEENDEITRKPPAVRYGRVMPEYRVINFRERRLSLHVRRSLSLSTPRITIRSFALSLSYYSHFGEPLVGSRMLELQLHVIGTVNKPRFIPLPLNVSVRV